MNIKTIESLKSFLKPETINTVYYQINDIGMTDIDVVSAYRGFNDRSTNTACYGYKFLKKEQIFGFDLPKGAIFVGGVSETRNLMKRAGIKCDSIDYPESLSKWFKRKIYKATLNEVYSLKGLWFVKPVTAKLFPAGIVFDGRSVEDGYRFESFSENTSVWISEIINPSEITAEFRCYICNKDILDIRRYNGSFLMDSYISDKRIKDIMEIIIDYEDAPNAYAIDITEHGQIIEINDAWSLGNYGMDDSLYSIMIETRWKELWSKC